MAPRVLVSDKLSETAVQIFRDRGVDVDYKPDLGKDKDALLAAIPNYDGHQSHAESHRGGEPSQGHRPRRHRR